MGLKRPYEAKKKLMQQRREGIDGKPMCEILAGFRFRNYFVKSSFLFP
jgi:hypothetical protein